MPNTCNNYAQQGKAEGSLGVKTSLNYGDAVSQENKTRGWRDGSALRELAVLLEDQGLMPSLMWQLTTTCQLQFQRLQYPLWLSKVCTVHGHYT